MIEFVNKFKNKTILPEEIYKKIHLQIQKAKQRLLGDGLRKIMTDFDKSTHSLNQIKNPKYTFC